MVFKICRKEQTGLNAIFAINSTPGEGARYDLRIPFILPDL